MIILKNKKALSSVVAISLLLIITAISVVLYDSWLLNYLSGDFVKVEQYTHSHNNIKIEKIDGNLLWILNNVADNFSIKKLKIDINICNNVSNLNLGLSSVDISDCIVNISSNSPVIVLYFADEIVEKKMYVKDAIIGFSGESLGIGGLLNCSNLYGGEWIKVSGNYVLGTNDFCVMKYEVKNSGGIPISSSSLTPWVSITQTNAIIKCDSLNNGTGNYHLITDLEWITIARIAENDVTNWADGVIGSTVNPGGLYRGNVNLIDSIGCGSNNVLTGTVAGSSCVVGLRNERTLNISGSLIWDFSGNVWEWTNNSLPTTGVLNSYLGISSGWQEWSIVNSSLYGDMMLSNATLTSSQGIGKFLGDSGVASDGGSIHAFLRGGAWAYKTMSGVLSLSLNNAPTTPGTGIGFRCTYAE